MKYIDLHVHSNISDGTLSPTEVVNLAAESGLIAIALTDHDTIDGVKEAKEQAKQLMKTGVEITVIPGTELSASYLNRDIHILGLFVDIENTSFRKALENACKERDLRNIKMCENLNKVGIPITVEAMKLDNPNTIITRAHFAKYLYENGYVKSREEAFQKYLHEHGPYYVPRQYLTPEEAISYIKEAGGIPVLAHPLLYKFSHTQLVTLIQQLKKAGLVGIEAIYSCNISNDESYVKSLAREYDLVITGGSDFHGANKPHIQIGKGKGNLRIPESILSSLRR